MKNIRYKSDYKKKFSAVGSADVKRNISPFLVVKIFFSDVIFSVGFIFVVIGLLFLFIFGNMVNFNDLKLTKKSPVARGKITKITRTNATTNNVHVLKYDYEFIASDGKRYKGSSYSTRDLDSNVNILYLSSNPEISKIENTTSGTFPLWLLLFIAIFPVFGLFAIFSRVKKVNNQIQIIKIGQVALGVYQKKLATGSKVNEMPVYKVFFLFKVNDKLFTATGETYRIERIADEDFEPVVFNPSNPEEAIVLDTLPKSVRKIFSREVEQAKLNLPTDLLKYKNEVKNNFGENIF